MVKKLPKGEKIFSFFNNLFHIFPLPLRKKTKPLRFSALFITGNHLLFPPFFTPEIGKTQGKTCHKNFLFCFLFFFLLFCTLPLLVIGKITTYLFFPNSDLMCLKMPLSALKFNFLQITFFPP